MDQQLHVLIVDDDPLSIEHLRRLLHQFLYIHIVGELTDRAGLIELLRTVPVDLVFLDIQMRQESGFSIAEYINKTCPDKMIVFITGFEDFALRGYDYEPLDFLTKPVSIFRLEKTLSHAIARKFRKLPCPHVKVGIQSVDGLRIVEVDQILYIEKKGRKVQVVCGNPASPKRIVTHSSLRKLEEIFDMYDFVRIHQSFLVPARRILALLTTDYKNSYQVELEGVSERLPLSRQKYAQLREMLEGSQIRII